MMALQYVSLEMRMSRKLELDINSEFSFKCVLQKMISKKLKPFWRNNILITTVGSIG